jgi:hypothetical protein
LPVALLGGYPPQLRFDQLKAQDKDAVGQQVIR